MVVGSPLVPLAAQNRVHPSYDEGMERLAEILGSLHYLDNLCNSTREKWRNFMDRLLLSENPESALRTRLVSAFNRSWRAFAENYHQCTPAAVEANKRYHQEGTNLTRELINRYGG